MDNFTFTFTLKSVIEKKLFHLHAFYYRRTTFIHDEGTYRNLQVPCRNCTL